MGLNKKQEMFVDNYLLTWNQRAAARHAGYPESAATRVYNTPSVQEEMVRRLNERRITKDEVLDRLARMVRSSLGELISVDGDEWKIDIPAAIRSGAIDNVSELKQKKGGLIEIKKVDNLKSLILAAKLLGLEGGELSQDESDWYESIPDDND